MPQFQVFHHQSDADRCASFSERAYAQWPLHYHRVAVVEASVLGEVFELTNHGVDETRPNWAMGPAVTLLDADPRRVRSTSVGDVIIDEQGQVHGVAGIGFTPLGALKRCRTCAKPVYDWKVPRKGFTRAGLWCHTCTLAGLRKVGWA